MGIINHDFSKEAFELMKKADAGDAQAQYTFGTWLLKDEEGFFRKDLSEEEIQRGMKYLQAAAAQCHFYGIAADALGMIYFNGDLVPVDYKKAKMWFSTARMGGIPTSTYMLGECAYYGYDEEVNYEKAAKLYSEGSGYINSLYRLADMYLSGEYLPYDPVFAKELYDYVLWTEEELFSKHREYSTAYDEVCRRLADYERKQPEPPADEIIETEGQAKIRNRILPRINRKKAGKT